MAEVVSIVGARPQFIKSGPVSRALRAAGHRETVVHTGQHYDANMSDVFFDELELEPAAHNLGIGSGSHGAQTAAMLGAIEAILLRLRPDHVLVYGDTNSTLAGALAAIKLHIPIAHVEAGLRSFDRAMPEEVNRVLTDHASSLLFAPSEVAAANLRAEGITRGVHVVGDVMAEALAHAAERAQARSTILDTLGVRSDDFLLATIHRAENTDSPQRLAAILAALEEIDAPIVFPVHPRTRKVLAAMAWPRGTPRHLRLIDPVGYLDMVRLQQAARAILTDSGGVQKEAYWLGRPCITLRDTTEWVETVETGWNRLVGADTGAIVSAATRISVPSARPPLYGDGMASDRIAALL
jgi:UDP-N-acetylglucosamine 2-epimerase